MSRRTVQPSIQTGLCSRLRQKQRVHRLGFEPLEERTMLDNGGLPAAIVIGRTLATPSTAATATPSPSYFAGEVEHNQVTITITVYNEQADPETGVLVTDTLAPGVTLASASTPPNRSGQDLAWSLGTIQGYDRASVSMTVNLPNASTLQLDTGAKAYAMLDAGAVSASTPAATLHTGDVADPNLLAATVDADTNDPFIQEEAAKLSYNSTQIFDFLHTQVGYNCYLGSVRGARGTLWSNAGNALDVASLGVALMRASGIPAQYASGTLAQNQAQSLILSMFPAPYQTVGYVTSGTQTSVPTTDSQLLSETESHDWFQYDTGSGMTDADPLMPGATIGQTYTASTGTFTAVPQDLEETTEVQVVAEITSTAGALFGLGGQQDTTGIDQVFDDVQLVGRPITLGFNVTSSGGGFIFTTTTNTYSPYLALGDDAYDSTHDRIFTGQSFQETLTNFPFGSSVLTGVFLKVIAGGPQGPSQAYDRTLFDRIGYAARQGKGSSGISVPPGATPAFTNYDAFTLDVSAASDDPHPTAEAASQMQKDAAQLAAAAQGPEDQAAIATSFARGFDFEMTRALGNNFLTLSQLHTNALATTAGVAAYYARPRIVLVSARYNAGSGTTASGLSTAIDLVNDSLRAEAAPGQALTAPYLFQLTRGMFENLTERDTIAALSTGGQATTVDNTYDVFQAAAAQGIGFTDLTADNLGVLDGLAIPDDTKARITTDVEQGFGVIVPDRSVLIDGTPTIAWAEIDLATGEYFGVDANGGHQGAFEFLALVGQGLSLQIQVIKFFSPVAGFDAGALLGVSYQLNTLTGSREQAAASLKVEKQKVEASYKTLISNGSLVANLLSLSTLTKAKIIDKVLAALISQLRSVLPVAQNAFNEALDATVMRLTGQDPEVTGVLSDPVPLTELPSNRAAGTSSPLSQLAGGAVHEVAKVPSVSVRGQVAATWSSTATSGFLAGSLSAANASIVGAGGKVIGTGGVALSATGTNPLIISGDVNYAVSGVGSLSSYGATGSGLGVGGDWRYYTATVGGDVTITLSVPDGVLALNGNALPAGTYTITTHSATLAGGGSTSTPTFSGRVDITATNATIDLGPGSGSLSVGGKSLDPADETTLDGYDGAIAVSANSDGTDSVSLDGNAGNVLQVTASPPTLTTDQNTPVTFAANVQTSLSDTYNLTANAPAGWTVTIDGSGHVTATPAPGLQGGTYPIQIIAQSQADPNLEAQTIVAVTITPTQPGMNLAVATDPQFTVPYNGAQLPTAFRATIQNVGPAADTYNLTFSDVPGGFTVQDSGSSVKVPAGETGILGIYLVPNPGQPIPAPGTQVSFNVTATSTADPSITRTQTETFTVPNIDAVAMTSTPTALTSTPGTPASASLTLTNDGNVSETVNLSASTPAGLTAGSLGSVTLAPGASQTLTLTLTPAPTAALNQTLATTITAGYGPSNSPLTTTAEVDLLVRSAQTVAVSQASIAAGAANNPQLASVLSDLSDTLASLQSATSPALFVEAKTDLGNLSTLLSVDPALASFAARVQPLIADAGSSDLADLLASTTSLFNDITDALNAEATEQFTASLSPGEVDLQPGAGQTLTLTLTNTGPDAETLNLTTGNVPSGAAVHLGQSTVSLAAGQTTTVDVTLTQNIQSSTIFDLRVTASASLVSHTASAVISIRPALADVLSVTATPQAVNPGDSITVSAQVFNTANATRSLQARLQLLDSTNTVVSTAPLVPFSIDPSNQDATVNLGDLNTAGLADGLYTLEVNLLTSVGTPLPGRSATTPVLVGIPITASASPSSGLLAPGTSTVATTILAQNATNIVGAVYNNATDFSVAGNPNGPWSYGYLSPGASLDSSTFTPFTKSGTSGGLKEWWAPFALNTPSVFDNPTSGVINYGTGVVQPGEAGFHPGPDGQYGVYRFTVPVTGSYSINAKFTGIDNAGGTRSDVHVLDDGNSLFQANINGYLDASTYSGTVNLNAGDIVDFAVGYGADSNYLFDSTGLDATLTFHGASSRQQFVLYYTQFSGAVGKVTLNYDGTTFSVGTPTTVRSGIGADGLIFLPDGNLLTANGSVTGVNPITGETTTVGGNGSADHLALDPSGQMVWTSGQPGPLEEIPLNPLSNAIQHPLQGDDSTVTALAFDAAGSAYYAASSPNGPGSFGLIDLHTFTTQRIFSNLPAAHGLSFDPFTGDLILYGTNHVTQIDPRTLQIVSDFTFTSFGVSLDQGAVDGKGHVYVADNGGHLLFIDYSKTGLVGDPSNNVAAPFLVGALDDVAPLSGLGSIAALVEVKHSLPASGYAVDTSSITPTPGSSTPTEIDWLGGLLSGSTASQQFQLTGQVTDMAPGETREISTGTSLEVQFTSGNGQQLQATLDLPPVTVAAEHIIGLTPGTQTVDLGARATFAVQLTNPYSTDVTYDLATTGLDGFTTSLAASVTVPAGQTVTTPLVVSVPMDATPDLNGFEVLATTTGGVSDSVEGELTVTPQVALQDFAVSLGLTPARATAGQGTSAQYLLAVTNVGSAADTYTLTTSGLPSGVTATPGQNTVDVPPGISNFRDVPLVLKVARGTAPGSYPFTVTATSGSDAGVTSTATGTLIVTAGGVQVTLNPPSGAPGSGFQATVTNTGTVTDTYNLSLGGPAALVASLATKQVTLAPGASQVVPISTGAVNFAVQGNLNLLAMATSTSNPAIQNGATAALAVPETTGLTAEFSPATRALSGPGMVTFLLMVHNTGNTRDSYSATILTAHGPVAATLVGLEGSPTQSIPSFILPGLSTGAIELQAKLSDVGTGTITVLVQSLTSPESASPVAQAIVSSTPTPTPSPSPSPSPSPTPTQVIASTPSPTGTSGSTTGPGVRRVQRYGYHMMPTTVVLTFDQALDPATAGDVHDYRVDGPGGGHIKVRRAVYSPIDHTVSLHFARRLSLHHPYVLTLVGTGHDALSNEQGQPLDSPGTGRPGGDARIRLTGRQLVLDGVTRRFLRQHHIRPKADGTRHHSRSTPLGAQGGQADGRSTRPFERSALISFPGRRASEGSALTEPRR